MNGLVERLRPNLRPRTPRTVGELLARFGRAVLWLAVGIVLLRGIGSTFATERPARITPSARVAAAPSWPDDAARSFALTGSTHSLAGALAWIVGLLAVFVPLSVWRYRRMS